MKPLQSVAMGLVIVALSARFGGYDALADPAGWVLVVLGVSRLPAELPQRGTLLGLAALAGVVSAVVWFPSVTAAMYDADASLAWAANLPQIAFSALLCQVLSGRAVDARPTRGRAAGSRPPARRWSWSACSRCWSSGPTSRASRCRRTSPPAAVALLLIWLLFAYAARPWAQHVAVPAPADERS